MDHIEGNRTALKLNDLNPFTAYKKVVAGQAKTAQKLGHKQALLDIHHNKEQALAQIAADAELERAKRGHGMHMPSMHMPSMHSHKKVHSKK